MSEWNGVRHIRSHQIKMPGKRPLHLKWGFATLCRLKVEYASTVPRLDLGSPATDYCAQCLESLVDKKTREIEMLKEILECANGNMRVRPKRLSNADERRTADV